MYPKESLIERKIVPPDVNEDAAQTVYKINPRPPQFGFSLHLNLIKIQTRHIVVILIRGVPTMWRQIMLMG